jgi:hypothetical protein
MDTLVIWLAIATILGTVFNGVQVLLAWFTLREVGDFDHDRKDWWEKLPWRHYRKDE